MKKRNTTSRLNKVDYSIFIICSLFASLMFFLFYKDMNSFSIKQNEKTVARISERENKVQRKFSNRNIWEKIGISGEIYDGDIIRTDKNSHVACEYIDNGIKVELDENSMIQIAQSKKENSVNFISGELTLVNTTDQIAPAIKTGVKKIEVSADSEVKLTAASEQEVVLEVISGQAEISNNEDIVKGSKTKDSGKVIKAGNTAVFNNNTEQMNITKVDSKESDSILAGKMPVKEIDINAQGQISYAKLVFPQTEYVQNGVTKKHHEISIKLSDLFGANKKIKKGTVIEITMSGVTDKNIRKMTTQVFNTTDWHRVHNYSDYSFYNSKGLTAGEKFEFSKKIYCTRDIENTSTAVVNIAYDPYILNEKLTITDFSYSAKIVTKNIKKVMTTLPKNYKKTIKLAEFNSLRRQAEEYGDSFGGDFPAEDIFGNFVELPVGTKIKFTVSGVSSKQIFWSGLSLGYNQLDDSWIDALCANGSEGIMQFNTSEIAANKQFKFSQVYTIKQPLYLSDIGVLSFYIGNNENLNIKDFVLEVEAVD